MVSKSGLHSNMNKVFVLVCVFGLSRSSPVEQTVIFNEDGSYRFNFDTGKEAGSHFREETRQADGTVIGRYSYEDPTGSLRTVNYRAGREGFVATGDVGVSGAAPAQVPAVVPQVPQEVPPVPQGEPGQEVKPEEPVQPEDALQQDVIPEQAPTSSTVPPTPEANDVTPNPETDSIKVMIPDDQSRKREAGSPPLQYTDDNYPFQAPLFGKRRLDVPDEEIAEKPQAAVDDESKPDAKTPQSFVYHFGSPFIPQFQHQASPVAPHVTQFHHQPAQVAPHTPQFHHQPSPIVPQVAPQVTPQFHHQAPAVQQPPAQKPESINPMKYFYYVPTSSAFNYFPAVQTLDNKFQQPAVQSHFHSGPPKAWAYVPLSSLPQQQQVLPAAQPQTHPTTWAYIQPHAVTYIPADADKPKEANASPQVPSPSAPEVNNASVPESPVVDQSPIVDQAPVIDQASIKAAFNRPTVQHYHFKGPSNTYGYYYQY